MTPETHCYFCGRADGGGFLVASRHAGICDICVDRCVAIIAEEAAKKKQAVDSPSAKSVPSKVNDNLDG